MSSNLTFDATPVFTRCVSIQVLPSSACTVFLDVSDDEGKGRYTTEVAPHGVALLKVYPGNTNKRYNGKVTYAK